MIINYLITNIKAHREKSISAETQIGIANNITVTDVERDDKFKILKFTFKFEAAFTGNGSDDIGKIVIEGFIAYTGDNMDKIYSKWEEEKKLDESVTEEILQASLNISILEAMSIAKMLQLPSILPLPKISQAPGEEKNEKKKK
ncbi:MAG: hypothetical protein M1433_00605 [Candidatus Parvarchaeota archaeon]|nr:hypothetical protein [Candidatus Parvarchaeota archaeon]